MVTFRKSLLLLAIISLMAVAANAQVGITNPLTCVANAGDPTIVRSEGLAELVGDVVLICSGGQPTALNMPVPQINFRVFVNTTVTSRLLSGSHNEALLMIDEPGALDNQGNPVGTQMICGSDSGCPMTGTGEEPGVDYGNTYNVWQGTAITGNVNSSGNTIEWLGVPVDPPGTQAVRVIRITNVRVNAAERGVGNGLIPTRLTMYISAFGSTALPITNPTVEVAFIQKGMDFSATNASFLQCEDPEDTMTVTFEEWFATAFKVRNIANRNAGGDVASPVPQMVPGFIYNTETGFYNPGFGAWNAGVAGLASQGTRLMASFSNIPAGVSLRVSNRNVGGDDKATLVSGGSPMSWGSATGTSTVGLSGGSGSATWEIIGDDPIRTDYVQFRVYVDYTPNTQAGSPALGTGTVAGSYAPLSDLVTATSADLQPRFESRSDDIDHITINSCATNLLWPYVTNQAGFDTGLVISNTSKDPGWVVPQSGPCEIYYYGNSNGGPPPSMDTTPEVGAGGYAVWTLSSGGGVKDFGEGLEGTIAAAPGFEGYVIAHCQFQYAHGFGFISDLGAQKLAQGYIALILDQSIYGCDDCKDGKMSRTGSKSEPLNQ